MMFIAIKTKDGVIKGKLSFYCRMLGVSRQGFYKYLAIKDRPWKYQDLADAMRVIHAEDECNDTYGRIRMYQALLLKNPTGIKIPSERTVYRVMDEIGLVHRPKRKPNGITKADREARKSDDLLKREFKADKPLEKCVTDITEIKAKDGKLYVSAIFDCFDSSVLGLAMETNMKATLCEHTLDNAYLAHPDLRGAIVHSDRGRQYTSETYRQALSKYGIIQSMNSVMDEIGLVHRPKRKPNGITKADREARKSDDLLKREFKADKPLEKCVTDITEIKAKDGKLYVSAIFDCFDSSVLGLAMETNMKATLCEHTLDNAYLAHPDLRGAIVHSDRGRQYTSETYRQALSKYGIIQSMNSDGGRCHDNARCESMWARMKSELLYDRYNTESLTTDELRVLIWRYFISYWNNRRICSANGGLPPMIKRQRYYQSLGLAA